MNGSEVVVVMVTLITAGLLPLWAKLNEARLAARQQQVPVLVEARVKDPYLRRRRHSL